MHDGDGGFDVTDCDRPETNVKCDGNVKGNMDAVAVKALGLDQWFRYFGSIRTRELRQPLFLNSEQGQIHSFIPLTRSITSRIPVFESLVRKRKCKHIDRCWQDENGEDSAEKRSSRSDERGRHICCGFASLKQYSCYSQWFNSVICWFIGILEGLRISRVDYFSYIISLRQMSAFLSLYDIRLFVRTKLL